LLPSHYTTHLAGYYDVFSRDRILVLITEEFLADLRTVFEHLGVADKGFLPPGFDQARNAARSYRFLWLENLLVRSYRLLNRRGYTRLVKLILDSQVGELLRRLNQGRTPLPTLDPESERLLEDYFAPHNATLAQLLDRVSPLWVRQARGP